MIRQKLLRYRAIILFTTLFTCVFALPLLADPNYSSSYLYLTQNEQTRYFEYVWYRGRDTVNGPVRSNHDIGVHSGAIFNGFVTTSGVITSRTGSTFAGLPHPGYAEHALYYSFSPRADSIRRLVRYYGRYLNTESDRYTYGLIIDSCTATYWRWRTGTPSTMGIESEAMGSFSWRWIDTYPIYCDGRLWIKGVVCGRLGIAASGSIRIMDDLRCIDATAATNWLIPPFSSNSITLISEVNEPYYYYRNTPNTGILIANTWENGRDNGSTYPLDSTNRRDVVITAQLIALRSSVTFEDQNDTADAYQSLQRSDERGNIYFHGSIMQYRKGYLHRSTHGGTGYIKVMRYDQRWRNRPAPFAIPITN